MVMVGSVRIEIQEDDPNKTTNVHITSPKTVVTNVTETAERSQQEPQKYGPQRPTAHNSLITRERCSLTLNRSRLGVGQVGTAQIGAAQVGLAQVGVAQDHCRNVRTE